MMLTNRNRVFIGLKHFLGTGTDNGLLTGSVAVIAIKILGLACSYGVHVAVARIYGTTAMGVFGLAVVALGIASLLGFARSSTAMVRFLAASVPPGKSRPTGTTYVRILRALLPILLGAAVLLGVLATPLATHVWSHPPLAGSLRVMACLLPFLALHRANVASLNTAGRVGLASLADSVLPSLLLGLAVLVAGAKLPQTGLSVTLLFASSMALSIVASTAAARRYALDFGVSDRKARQDFSARAFLSVTFPIALIASLQMVLSHTDIIMLGTYAGMDDAGIYRVAAKLAMLAAFPLVAIRGICSARFARAYAAGAQETLRQDTRLASILVLGVTTLGALLLITLGRPLLSVFGTAFAPGYPPLIVLTIMHLASAGFGYVGVLLSVTGQEKPFRNIIACTAVANIVLNRLLIPRYGMTGAAIASCVCAVAWNLSAAFLVRKRLGLWAGFLPRFRFSAQAEIT